MPMPQRVCGLSIVLAFLLVRHSYAAAVSTEEPFTQYKSNDDKYDLVDVAEQHGDTGGTSVTGQTSRFYTNGEVDDDFWLKQLGEDFKRAIHLQVDGNEQYNGVYNMSEDGSAYKVQHEFIQKQNPVQANYESQQSTVAYNYSTEPQPSSTTNRPSTSDDNNELSNNSYRARNTKQTSSKSYSKNTTTDFNNKEASYERLLAHDDANSANSIYSGKDQQNHKYAKVQLINIKYNPKSSYAHKDPAAKNAKNNHKGSKNKSLNAPVVVDLPDSSKTVVHLSESDTPVVVKMPPVIYHHNPSYEADDTPTPTQSHTDTYQHPEPQASSTHYTEYQQYPHDQFQQFQLQQQHQHQHQHQHAHPFPVQQHEQHTHYQQYEPQNIYSPTPYGAATPPNSPQTTYQAGDSSADNSTHSLRYIFSKHSSNYGENQQQQSESNYPNYNRISRSSRDLFEQGL